MHDIFLALLLSVASWLTPQPTHSAGLLVIYGNDRLTAANARWHDYSLTGYAFGLASISPYHLGTIAWVRLPGGAWLGPGLVVDVAARADALESIFTRHEIGEITYATAAALGFANGGRDGEIFFGRCPPPATSRPLPYAPPLVLDTTGEQTPSLYPYPKQQLPIDCAASPVGQVRAE